MLFVFVVYDTIDQVCGIDLQIRSPFLVIPVRTLPAGHSISPLSASSAFAIEFPKTFLITIS